MLETFKVALTLILYVAVISLPGMGIAFLGWWLSRTMRPVSVQTLFRAGLLATAITPSFHGHAGPVPAIILVFNLQGRERLAEIVLILVVWLIATAVISARAKRERFRRGYLEEACAWFIFVGCLFHIVFTDFLHFRGSLDHGIGVDFRRHAEPSTNQERLLGSMAKDFLRGCQFFRLDARSST